MDMEEIRDDDQKIQIGVSGTKLKSMLSNSVGSKKPLRFLIRGIRKIELCFWKTYLSVSVG